MQLQPNEAGELEFPVWPRTVSPDSELFNPDQKDARGQILVKRAGTDPGQGRKSARGQTLVRGRGRREVGIG